ncbi:MAG: ABC transporter ATP-binding protein [Oscillospiraceae bacterium]|nr:ABC transporter ATP-binding protein [Oscillospiraceae bacterium]MCL2278731.1 ABC transporter ATP-binding protein [Oscillospiraceae bacterium]
MSEKLNKMLEIKNVHCYFDTKKGLIRAVDGVSLAIEEGMTLGVVGESGSGKSQTALSVLKLFEKNQRIHEGEVWFEGEKISDYSAQKMYQIRGNKISMIFQEPMTSLNPVFTVGRQIGEVLLLHQGMTGKQARMRAVEMLEAVKIPNAEKMINQYPHQLSGGMRQRVMIAMALACKPKLLIADEPTTALDVTIQAQILRLMNELKEEFNTAIMFITHDLGVINQMADVVAVMYCGQVVELAPVDYIFKPMTEYSHPYTEALLTSIPMLSGNQGDRLDAIPGSVPHPLDLPKGCRFAPRCKYATDKCKDEMPDLAHVSEVTSLSEGQFVRCFYPKKGVRQNG